MLSFYPPPLVGGDPQQGGGELGVGNGLKYYFNGWPSKPNVYPRVGGRWG